MQYLAQQPITIAILKDSNMDLNKTACRFGVLFDGSAIAEKALRRTISMMADEDRLSVITVVEPGLDKDAISPKVEAICAGNRAYDSVVLTNLHNCAIKERIKRYLREQDQDDAYIDFVVVGNRGLNMGNAADGDNYMGSVAMAMISMRRLNVIFCP